MILDLCLGTLSNGFRKWPSVGYPHFLFIHFWVAKIFYEDIRARGWRDSAQFKCRMFSDISIVDVDSWQLMSHVGWSDSKTADYFCRATKIIDATETALTLAKAKRANKAEATKNDSCWFSQLRPGVWLLDINTEYYHLFNEIFMYEQIKK